MFMNYDWNKYRDALTGRYVFVPITGATILNNSNKNEQGIW